MAFNIRFPGQYFDAETESAGPGTGLHSNFHRCYDPSIGRYVSADPIGQFGLVQWNLSGLNALLPGLVNVALRSGEPANLYQYARANPLSFIDPLGLDTTFVITRDYGVGSHAAVHVDNGGDGDAFLYDPAGSYVPEGSGRGSGDSFSGSEADLQSYIDYQKGTGSTVETYTFKTTPEEEAAIAAAAQKQGGVAPPYCAPAVSSAASAAPPFSGLNASIPGPPFGLRSQLKAFQKKGK